MRCVTARRAGETAAARLNDAGDAAVRQRFERTVLLAAPAGPVIVGSEDIEPGPLTLLVTRQDWLTVRAAVTWVCAPGRVRADDVVIDVPPPAVWCALPWPDLSWPTLPRLTDDLAHLVAASAPAEGLGRSLMSGDGGYSGLASRVARTADRHAAALAAWIRNGSGAPPTGLVGLGDGATPAGDDVLAGAMLLLTAVRSPRTAALAEAVRSQLPAATSPLSAALLDEAAAGRAGESLMQTVAALVSGCREDMLARARIAARHGHSSGCDALAGVVLAARAISAAP